MNRFDQEAAVSTKKWCIGDVTITRIVELGGIPVPTETTFNGLKPDHISEQAWLQPHFATSGGLIYMTVQAFVIESRGRCIVVDTCVGNDKERSVPYFNQLQGRFLEDIAAAGFPAEGIDTVLCTHLHVDHVGWNTRFVAGQWVPTFPNARYLIGRVEWEHWGAEGHDQDHGDIVGDSVRPIFDAGLADLIEMNHLLTDEVRLIPTPGHTPGHVSVMIESCGLQAVITGDVMHHPLQCSLPDQASIFDSDEDSARATRRRFLNEHSNRPVVVFGTHFSHPTAGWINEHGAAWRFDVGPDLGSDAIVTLSADGLSWARSFDGR